MAKAQSFHERINYLMVWNWAVRERAGWGWQ
jgi:hypothetical protein